MQPFPRAPRSGRLALVGAGLVVLLGVVAFASRSGFGHSGHAEPNARYVSYAFTVFLVLFVLMIPITIWAWLAQARESAPNRKPRTWRSALALPLGVAVFGVLVWVRHWLHLRFHTTPPSGRIPHGTGRAPGKLHHGHAAASTAPHFEWLVVWIALGLAAVSAVALLVAWRRWKQREATAGPGPSVAEQVVATIGDAIDDLRREPDPRRAVIAAYARMERTFERHGLGRRPSETPIEYLGRVLNDLSTSGDAVRRLTGLFERAKFSNHDVTDEMKQDAIDALDEIRAGIG